MATKINIATSNNLIPYDNDARKIMVVTKLINTPTQYGNPKKEFIAIAKPTTVTKSVIIVENSAMAQLKYLDEREGCVLARTCDNVKLE